MQSHLLGHGRGAHHANRHALTMEEGAVFGGRLQRVANGMAIVQHDSDAQGLPFILADHIGLDGHAPADDIGCNLGFNIHQGFRVLFEHIHQTGIQYEAVLDSLGPALRQFPLAQGRQCLNVGEHTLGLIEGTNQVFGLGQVDGDLAADGRIHHRRHAGGNLDEGHAPQVGCGYKTAQVPGNAAADADDCVATLGF